MGTKINPLDYGVVTDVQTSCDTFDVTPVGSKDKVVRERISMDIQIKMVFDTEEDFQIVSDAIIDNIKGNK